MERRGVHEKKPLVEALARQALKLPRNTRIETRCFIQPSILDIEWLLGNHGTQADKSMIHP